MSNIKKDEFDRRSQQIDYLKRSARDFTHDIDMIERLIKREIYENDEKHLLEIFELGIMTLSLKNNLANIESKFKHLIKHNKKQDS